MPDPFPPIAPVRVRAAGVTHEGPGRDHNEDAFGVFEDATSAIAIVADGVGRTRPGEPAARRIVDICKDIFRGRSATVLDDLAETWWVGEHGAGSPGARVRPFSTLPIAERVGLRDNVRRLLDHRVPEAMGDVAVLEAEKESLLGLPARTLARANAELHRRAEKDRSTGALGGAAACAIFAAGCASIAHVGDARVYRMRDGALEALTTDHTLVNEYARLRPTLERDLTDEEIAHIPTNVLSRVIGYQDKVDLDTTSVPVTPGDVFLLATNGFWRAFSETELLVTLRSRGTGAAAYLVERGARRPPEPGAPGDDLTAVVVEVL